MQNASEDSLLVQKGYEGRIIPKDEIVFCEIIDRKIYLKKTYGGWSPGSFYERNQKQRTLYAQTYVFHHRRLQYGSMHHLLVLISSAEGWSVPWSFNLHYGFERDGIPVFWGTGLRLSGQTGGAGELLAPQPWYGNVFAIIHTGSPIFISF